MNEELEYPPEPPKVQLPTDGEDPETDGDAFMSALPRSVFEEYIDEFDHELRDSDELKSETGLELRTFHCCEEDCGFGVSILYHDWDNGVKEVQPLVLAETADKTMQMLRGWLQANLTGPVKYRLGTFIQTDYP